jgi:hypothetical protein
MDRDYMGLAGCRKLIRCRAGHVMAVDCFSWSEAKHNGSER